MRCIRAVKALRSEEGSDLQAVALYTEIERDAPFVRHADLAVALPGVGVAAYLDHDALIKAALQAGADAVWPGWGFVAEDPRFVAKLADEGIRFLGPSATAMRALGDKIGAKKLAEEVGVPVTPWSGGAVEDEAQAETSARALGFPVVVKASAGGGGRGIRVVEEPDALIKAFRSARSEALSAFGDGRLFIERKVEGGRHIEVQIAADRHGAVVAIGCRDCSVQRRHQKVLEEAPPPGLSAAAQGELKEAAVRIASSVGYTGVGTVEFLVARGAFHFLEMNPRLQVEHGISEAITGLDLVQLQLRIARGESLAELEIAESGFAIEARVCAEDPDRGHLPAPGRIARFDPALGPGLRLDTGVATGSVVPASFDSLIAKVIAKGQSRESARARLVAALEDFDLVIEGGATNKGYLTEILNHADFRRGGVTTTWLDRYSAQRERDDAHAAHALLTAAILSYRQSRAVLRRGFYADASNIAHVPASVGQQVDLSFNGEQYRLEVYATGSWRYRVHLDGRVLYATLRAESPHTARLKLDEQVWRVLYDIGDAGLRIEIEGCAFAFSSQSAGQVRASAPAMVVALHVKVGDVVSAGQSLGVLEAMKMEVAFDAPVSGVVTELRVQSGAQVAAGDVILVIDPASKDASAQAGERITFHEQRDPLAALFAPMRGEALGVPDLVAAERAAPSDRRAALDAVREETRRVLLGYDVNPARTEHLAEFLEARVPEEISHAFRSELAELRSELVLLADVTQLFIRAPGASVSGAQGPSNEARLRMYARRVRAGGAGIAPEYLELLGLALAHYGITSLDPCDALERAVLRLLASQRLAEHRDRLVLAMLRRLTLLAKQGVTLSGDAQLARALEQIPAMRGLLSNPVADAAIEARYEIFERPGIEAQAERTTKALQAWLETAATAPSAPPESVLQDLANAQRSVFDRIGNWIASDDPRRRAIALVAHLHRNYALDAPVAGRALQQGELCCERLELPDGGVVLGAACTNDALPEAAGLLIAEAWRGRAKREWSKVRALEFFVPLPAGDAAELDAALTSQFARELPALRITVSFVRPLGPDLHRTLLPTDAGFTEDASLHGLHPEAAARVELSRLENFALERFPAPDGIYCFRARAHDEPEDERIFVLADMRSRSPDDGREADLHVAAFEHVFYEATRALRGLLALHDPKRRLQWNRIAIFVRPEIFLGEGLPQRLARNLAPATRNLGLEKVVVRIKVLDRAAPAQPAQVVEVVVSDVTGMNMTMRTRAPRSDALQAHSAYERRVVEARRRRLVYPYEILRMLTGSDSAASELAPELRLPHGDFCEHDLDPNAPADAPRAVSVAGRNFGENQAGVVFGLISTPTDKVPEGMERVIVLSDPTRGMGSLAGPECDRVVAAIELAEARGIPLEWIPVSSGARIAMDSGTENLDATARVVRRIIEFTDAGGVINIIVAGVNVGAQSYWNALATMGIRTRGALIMTQNAAMVLTGRAALEASGSVSAEDETAIGGFERVMGPNGEAQYFAASLADAFAILYEHYRYSYVVPGEAGPRPLASSDPAQRTIQQEPADAVDEFQCVGEIFSDEENPGRKRPFSMRAVMDALRDRDGGALERWSRWVGAETAIVWDAHLGGQAICLIGIESRNIAREGYRPHDGPDAWNGGTLFPQSSKKVARTLNAVSGNRPAVLLANLSGFDGSPESMRKLQLEYGAEIARAVVNFDGPLLFLVVSRYHGGAYVVFSRVLNPGLRAAALEGSYASVIGGGPAAAVIFAREARARATGDPRVTRLAASREQGDAERRRYERTLSKVLLEKQAELAREFDAIHTVERAQQVGSLEEIVAPPQMRAWLIKRLAEERARR